MLQRHGDNAGASICRREPVQKASSARRLTTVCLFTLPGELRNSHVTDYSQCLKEGYDSRPDAESTSRGLFRRQTHSTPVTGAVDGGVQLRQPVQRLQADADAWNMYILGLTRMMQVAEANDLSYYQISGIHGLPHIPWQEPASDSQDTDYGYCTHASGLFGTWHRPYVALFEQRVVFHAVSEAGKFADPDRSRYVAAAQRVRLPYWDWSVDNSRIPSIVMQTTISVVSPDSSGRAQRTTIRNPLYSYRFTNQAFKNEYFSGLYQQAAETLRQPTSPRTSQNNVANAAMMQNYDTRRQNTYNLFSIPSFAEFSSTAVSASGAPNTWTSVESIHNQVHASVGGTTPGLMGHMSLVDLSSFDPIFWMHHANVDRLVAIYQAIYPNRRVTPQPATPVFARRVQPGDMDTIDTPLWPFKKPNGQYYTSRDVSSASSIWGLGYAYPEVPAEYSGRSAAELSSFAAGRVNALYAPSSRATKRAATTKRREWLCHFVFIPAEVGSTAELDVYFKGANLTTINANGNREQYVGGGAALGKLKYTDHDKTMKITAAVPLTVALENDGVDTNNIVGVVRHLKDNLTWVMRKVFPPSIPVKVKAY
ncbi:hypothetical protein FN846DRAFT_783234 [Sphaerosporella brunnea]|uniref:tyrosinase n=1 Tax=Sphaerosporella brunnea TaxID=1250544 RepID=A0A5J5EMH3_9PEZI|nr:hypothetical protein FN846DRAFT_783234 [Sphaerosporella brunnea]